MTVTFLLNLALVGGLTFAILYPDDPGERGARVRRTLLTVAAYTLAIDVAVTVVEAPVSQWIAHVAAPGLILSMVQLALVPFSIADRAASFARPRRTWGWAAIGIAGGLAWSGALYLMLWRQPHAPEPGAIFAYVASGVAAGLVWQALLPRPDRSVGEVFE